MVSILKTDKIQASHGTEVEVSSGHELHTDTLKGTTIAGSVTVQGEGTNTTNLQQGLAKMWGKIDQQDGSPAIAGSFNLASLTDNSTGNTTHTFTNAMNDDNYSGQGQCNSVYVSTIESYNTGSFRQRVFNLSSSGSDRDDNATAVFGDLA